MRCSSYCTAGDYDIPKITNYLQSNGYEPKLFDDVIYAQKEIRNNKTVIDIFFFNFGCTIIWGGSEQQELDIIKAIESFEIDKPSTPVSEFIYFEYDQSIPRSYIDEEQNKIILSNESPLIKLSISHALAQSVKLSILELSVNDLIIKTTPIQKELANTGSVSLSKKEISKQIGILFNERYSINLHSDILDTPEFFWRRPSYEPLYLMTVEFQDIQLRQNILNHRLDMIQELYDILSNELKHKHSTRLEVIIIILIAIEVSIAVIHNDTFAKILNMFI